MTAHRVKLHIRGKEVEMEVTVPDLCSVCREPLGEGARYELESAVFGALGRTNVYLGWHPACVPKMLGTA